MKIITQLSCLLFVSFVIMSCSKDDDKKTAVFSNTVTLNEEVVDIDLAELFKYGSSDTHYSFGMRLSGTSSDGKPFFFWVSLRSKGTESLNTGTFLYYDANEETEKPDFYYSYIEILKAGVYIEVEADAGNIIVSGSGTNFSISGDLILDNDNIVKVSYSGTFMVKDFSEEK